MSIQFNPRCVVSNSTCRWMYDITVTISNIFSLKPAPERLSETCHYVSWQYLRPGSHHQTKVVMCSYMTLSSKPGDTEMMAINVLMCLSYIEEWLGKVSYREQWFGKWSNRNLQCRMRLTNTKPCVVGCLYRPEYHKDVYVNNFENTLHLVQGENCELYLLGDLNCDILTTY